MCCIISCFILDTTHHTTKVIGEKMNELFEMFKYITIQDASEIASFHENDENWDFWAFLNEIYFGE